MPEQPEVKKEIRQSFLNKARSDKFQLTIPLPAILRNRTSRSIRSVDYVSPDALNFSLIGITVPNIATKTIDVPFGGQTPRVSSMNREPYEPVKTRFVIDNRFSNYWTLYKWLDLVHDSKVGHVVDEKFGGQLVNEYATDIVATGLDEYNKDVIEFKFFHCVPSSLQGFELDFQEPKEIESSFEFYFHQFEVKIL